MAVPTLYKQYPPFFFQRGPYLCSEGYCRLNRVPLKFLKSQCPMPLNVTLFGDRIIKEAVKVK